mgnify:CR=1 FL=1
MTPDLPGFDDVLAAAARIAPHAHRTPVLRSRSLDALAGAELHFKCENLQRIGAFKFRGASNAVLTLSDEEAARGVVTQSSGNHGAAVALACRLRGIAATVVVPHDAPRIKLAAIAAFGARIVHCEPGQAARNDVSSASGSCNRRASWRSTSGARSVFSNPVRFIPAMIGSKGAVIVTSTVDALTATSLTAGRTS